jgi:hypothetical protein
MFEVAINVESVSPFVGATCSLYSGCLFQWYSHERNHSCLCNLLGSCLCNSMLRPATSFVDICTENCSLFFLFW